MTAPLHIVHAIGTIARSAGGTSTFVAELANESARRPGTTVTIVTSMQAQDDVPLVPQVKRVTLPVSAVADWLAKRESARAVQVLHVHALWVPFVHAFIHEASRLDVPVVVSPHGMLEPNALRLRWLKKSLALLAYQRRDLNATDFLHATAMPEAETLRRFGLRQPIIVAPPGLDVPPQEHMRTWPDGGAREALYFSRIHPKKNLLGLLDAWAQVRPTGWTLRIVGPDDGGHAAVVRARIDALRLRETVSLEGPVYGALKQSVFANASLFILPSFTENFGIVVAEALAYGVPAIATHGTPWKELVDFDCGWWVSPRRESLVATLQEATHASTNQLKAMGLRGRLLAENRYQWPSVCERLERAYRWTVGDGPPPECVTF